MILDQINKRIKTHEQRIRDFERRQILIDEAIYKSQQNKQGETKICGFDKRICTEWLVGEEPINYVTSNCVNTDDFIISNETICQLPAKCPRHEEWEKLHSTMAERDLKEQIELYIADHRLKRNIIHLIE